MAPNFLMRMFNWKNPKYYVNTHLSFECHSIIGLQITKPTLESKSVCVLYNNYSDGMCKVQSQSTYPRFNV